MKRLSIKTGMPTSGEHLLMLPAGQLLLMNFVMTAAWHIDQLLVILSNKAGDILQRGYLLIKTKWPIHHFNSAMQACWPAILNTETLMVMLLLTVMTR